MPINALPEGVGSGKLKKKIRDLERLLRKPGLSATKKSEAERALEAVKGDLESAKDRTNERKISQKYHMVKFFERQKVLRRLKKPDASDEDLATWFYVTTFPAGEKYSALFAEGAAGFDHPYMTDVKKRMEIGKLPSGAEGLETVRAQAKSKDRKEKQKLRQ